MFPFLILIACVGQSSCQRNGTCGSSSFSAPSYIQQAAYHPIRYVESAPIPMRFFKIKHLGLDFQVYGYRDPADGLVTWERGDERNIKSYQAALAASKPKLVAAPTPVKVAWQLNGVEKDKLGTQRKPYTATTPEAMRFVAEAIEDKADVPKIHVTVIGSDDARAPVINDLANHAAFAGLRDDIQVQGYLPNEWPVDKSLGFQDGSPSIIVQLGKHKGDPKGGKEIYRAANYEMGPEKLAEELRKANPDYKPNLTPGPATGIKSGCPLGFTHEHLPIVVGLIVFGFILTQLPRKVG